MLSDFLASLVLFLFCFETGNSLLCVDRLASNLETQVPMSRSAGLPPVSRNTRLRWFLKFCNKHNSEDIERTSLRSNPFLLLVLVLCHHKPRGDNGSVTFFFLPSHAIYRPRIWTEGDGALKPDLMHAQTFSACLSSVL